MTREEVGKSLPMLFGCKNIPRMFEKLCNIAEVYDGTETDYFHWMSNYFPEETPMFEKWKINESGTYGFDAYDMPEYKVDTFYCYKEITKQSVSTISKWLQDKDDVKTILDFAGGTGLSTLQLALNFPDKKVYYYDTGKQKDFLMHLLNEHVEFIPENLIILSDLENRKFDLITVFEVIEHWQRPYDFVKDDLLPHISECGYMAETKTFGIMSIGHFHEYLFDDDKTSKYGKSCTAYFNKKLKNYFIPEFKGWNSRPIIYKRIKT